MNLRPEPSLDPQSSRFAGLNRLYGPAATASLGRAHVAVVGIGGVGSWAAEALARSGIGQLTLIDLDDICVSNVNRQLPALDSTIGQLKCEVMAERARAINPAIRVRAIPEFFTPDTAASLLAIRFDWVVDAIDQLANKCLLIAACRAHGLRIVTTGGAGGRRDPASIRVQDLAFTGRDLLLQQVRRKLRREYGFPPGGKTAFGVPAVSSLEPAFLPDRPPSSCHAGDSAGRGLNCDSTSGYGSAAFVTGAFGLAAAAVVVRDLAASAVDPASPNPGGRQPIPGR